MKSFFTLYLFSSVKLFTDEYRFDDSSATPGNDYDIHLTFSHLQRKKKLPVNIKIISTPRSRLEMRSNFRSKLCLVKKLVLLTRRTLMLIFYIDKIVLVWCTFPFDLLKDKFMICRMVTFFIQIWRLWVGYNSTINWYQELEKSEFSFS